MPGFHLSHNGERTSSDRTLPLDLSLQTTSPGNLLYKEPGSGVLQNRERLRQALHF